MKIIVIFFIKISDYSSDFRASNINCCNSIRTSHFIKKLLNISCSKILYSFIGYK